MFAWFYYRKILGKSRFGNNRKYLLRKITECPITKHLNHEDYQNNFITFIREEFFKAGKPRKTKNDTDWTIYNLWNDLHGINLNGDDTISIVSTIKSHRPMTLFFPTSRLFVPKPYIPSKIERANAIQTIKKELFQMLQNISNKMRDLNELIEIVLLEELVPKYIDMMDFPMFVQFEKEQFELKRNDTNVNLLNQVPQELLKNKDYYVCLSLESLEQRQCFLREKKNRGCHY